MVEKRSLVGDEFGVGDAVSWRLGAGSDDWLAAVLGERVPPPVGSLPVLDHLVGDEVTDTGAVVGAGGLRVAHHEDPAQQAWVPTAGSGTTEDVHDAPKWPDDTIKGVQFSGFLVDLEVADDD